MRKINALKLVALTIVVAFASGCARKKNSVKMLHLQRNMTMGQVQSHLGEPDAVVASSTDSTGSAVDIWEYSLALRDEEKHNTKVLFQVGGWFLCAPLLFFPQAWRSSWSYDTYFVKFVNKQLCKWGRVTDVVDVHKEYSQAVYA